MGEPDLTDAKKDEFTALLAVSDELQRRAESAGETATKLASYAVLQWREGDDLARSIALLLRRGVQVGGQRPVPITAAGVLARALWELSIRCVWLLTQRDETIERVVAHALREREKLYRMTGSLTAEMAEEVESLHEQELPSLHDMCHSVAAAELLTKDEAELQYRYYYQAPSWAAHGVPLWGADLRKRGADSVAWLFTYGAATDGLRRHLRFTACVLRLGMDLVDAVPSVSARLRGDSPKTHAPGEESPPGRSSG